MDVSLRSRFVRFPQVAALWLSFLAYSLIRAPIPAVNEPHYLAKARHYWQPEWCGGDLFLDSANPHLVFYQTFGWLTSIGSLETAALIGRVVALLLLAAGWDRLVSQLVPGKWTAAAAAWLFLLLQACGNFAGEWLVGGVESKVVAYALVMWGCGALLAGRFKSGGALLGGAVSFHPVVGGWCMACLAGGFVLRALGDWFRASNSDGDWRLPNLREYAAVAACGVACSLPGLIPAASLLVGTDPQIGLRADIIQVAIRLDHHLDPFMFPWFAYGYYAVLLVLWLALRSWTPAGPALRRLDAFTWMAVAIALCGWLAAAGPRPIMQLPLLAWRLKLLKLYPFRIVDLVVPFTLAVTFVQLATVRGVAWTAGIRRAVAGGFVLAFIASLSVPTIDRNPSRMAPQVRRDWIAALQWIAGEAPLDSLLWAPDEDWAVKWFGERAEYVNFKDCPQDAAGIVEWYRRRVLLAKWKRAAAADGRFSVAEMRPLRAETGVTHIIVSRMGPLEGEPAFANGSFRVYELPGVAETANP